MKFFVSKKTEVGFTLVETIVYLAIFLMISVSAVSLLFSLEDLFTQYRLKQSLLANGNNALERILTEIREAESVEISESVFASSTVGTLALNKNGDVIKFIKNSTAIHLHKNDVLQAPLTGTDVQVTNSTYYYYVENNKELVRVRLSLSATIGDQMESWVISGGAILRATYDES